MFEGLTDGGRACIGSPCPEAMADEANYNDMIMEMTARPS